jgi:hypothetical protein
VEVTGVREREIVEPLDVSAAAVHAIPDPGVLADPSEYVVLSNPVLMANIVPAIVAAEVANLPM